KGLPAMFKSMTGFAREEFDQEGLAGAIQIKSYNNRYLDISLYLPSQLAGFEPRLQSLLSSRIRRGKIEYSFRVKSIEKPAAVRADSEAAKALYAAFGQIAGDLGLDEKPSLALLASFEGVISFDKEVDSESLWPIIEARSLAVLESFETSRLVEGEATSRNIDAELARFEAGLATVDSQAVEIDTSVRTQLKARFEEILPKGYDETRMLQELAVQLVRLSINEEVSRLKAHIQAFKTIRGEEAPSKRLDFLCQEMNRETNTIGSKNMLIPVAHAVVEMKDALENIREQLRNIE
ncbi:MAG: YicC/YloC family endoribonuclease, partial [Spirochaetia bacterium]|nr:YicC/YloC family endoribonuclease [Spirochaetia bacterium]